MTKRSITEGVPTLSSGWIRYFRVYGTTLMLDLYFGLHTRTRHKPVTPTNTPFLRLLSFVLVDSLSTTVGGLNKAKRCFHTSSAYSLSLSSSQTR